MPVWNTYAKRKRDAAGNPDVYQYEVLPAPLRVQVVHIWISALGRYKAPAKGYDDVWRSIHDILAREFGVFDLGTSHLQHFEQCQQFIQKAETDQALDAIEVSFQIIDGFIHDQWDNFKSQRGLKQKPDEAIEELNTRFRERVLAISSRTGRSFASTHCTPTWR